MPRLIKPRVPLSQEDKRNARIAFTLAALSLIGVVLHIGYFLVVYNFNDWLAILVLAVVFIMPGWLANAGMLVVGGGPPLDFGHVCKDGRRLFGPGKTIRGFFLGPLIFGVGIALAIHGVLYYYWPAIDAMVHGFIDDPNVVYKFYPTYESLISDLKLYLLGDPSGTNDAATFAHLVPRVILCAYGAAVGDLVGSWLKRRFDRERGAPFWGVDQLDFILGCFALALPYVALSINPHTIIFLLIFTPSLTIIANTISYLTGHKKVPW